MRDYELDALTHLLHEAILHYSQADDWPILGDDLPAAEWLSGYLSARWKSDLLAETVELRATIEARDEALMLAGRDNLRLHAAFRRVDALARDLRSTTHDTVAPHWVAKLITNALDGAPDPRRVEADPPVPDVEPWHGKAADSEVGL